MGTADGFCSSFTEGRFRKIIIKNSHFEVYSPQFHSSIADTSGYNVVEELSITSNRTDADVAYLTAGSKKTPMCKRSVNHSIMPAAAAVTSTTHEG